MPRSRRRDYPQLALTGLLTFFGSLNAAVPFLLDLFRIPADTFQLFLATGVINARVGTLVAAMHTVTVALLGACAIGGTLRFDRRRVLRYLAITAVLTVRRHRRHPGGLCRHPAARVHARQGARRDAAAARDRRGGRAPNRLRRPSRSTRARFSRASATAACCGSAICPTPCRSRSSTATATWWASTWNWRTVLARRAGRRGWNCGRSSRATIDAQLSSGYCDLVMSGVAVTTGRARGDALFGLLSRRDTRPGGSGPGPRARSRPGDAIGERPATTIAVPNLPYYIDKIRQAAPRAHLLFVTEADVATLVAERGPRFDAIAMHRGTRIGVDAAVSGSSRSSSRSRASSRCRWPIRSRKHDAGVRELHQHLDRPEAQGRHDRRALRLLGARPRRGAAPAALVDHPQRPALGGVTHDR